MDDHDDFLAMLYEYDGDIEALDRDLSALLARLTKENPHEEKAVGDCPSHQN